MVTLQILVLPFLVRVRVAQRRKTEPMHICIGSVVFIPHNTYYIQNKGNISLFPIPDADNTLKREELWRSHRKIQVKLNFRSACTIFNACLQTLNIGLNNFVVLLWETKVSVVATDAFIPRRRKTANKFNFIEFPPRSTEKMQVFSLYSLVEICVFARLALSLMLAAQALNIGGASENCK